MPIEIIGDLSLHLEVFFWFVYLFSAYFTAPRADKAHMEASVFIITLVYYYLIQ